MRKYVLHLFYLVVIVATLAGCKAFKHGLTWDKAVNNYHLVTGDKDNFGDRRLDYNIGFHRKSALSNFLNCECNERGMPDFIYEYQTDKKQRGIKLFYVQRDSVFIFEEPKKNNLQSVLKEAKKMDDADRQAYLKLKAASK